MREQEKLTITKESFDLQVVLSSASTFSEVYALMRDKLRKYRNDYIENETEENLESLNKVTNEIKKLLNDLYLYTMERLDEINV